MSEAECKPQHKFPVPKWYHTPVTTGPDGKAAESGGNQQRRRGGAVRAVRARREARRSCAGGAVRRLRGRGRRRSVAAACVAAWQREKPRCGFCLLLRHMKKAGCGCSPSIWSKTKVLVVICTAMCLWLFAVATAEAAAS